ncbi:MAG: CdaR family protein [Vicingaceae bacterium]
MKIKKLFFDSKKGKIDLDKRVTIFFFCLLLSASFWFLAALSKNYTTNLRVPLKYVKMSDDFLLTEEPPKQIDIKVSGNGFELLGEQMSLDRSAVEVNLNYARPLKNGLYAFSSIRLEANVIEALDKDLNLEQIITDSIIFKTQEKVSLNLPVRPKLKLSFKTGFNIRGKAIITPEMVKVSGPKNIVDSLSFIETKELNYSEIADSVSYTIGFNTNNLHENLTVEPTQVKVFVPVEKFTEKVFNLELETENSVNATSIRTFPNEVKAVFLVPLSQYEGFNEDMILAKVSYNSESKNLKKLEVIIEGIPTFAKLLRLEPDKVEFIIKK